MINVNDNTILNPENVVIAEQKGSMYKLTLINGKTLYVNKDVYEDIIVYEPVSKEYVDSKLSGALKRLIVQALPVENIDTNTIYMVLDTESSEVGNVYNEYLYINNAWELIGTTKASGPVYTAGANIQIDNNVISATYTAGVGITIANGVISTTGGNILYVHNIKIFYNDTNPDKYNCRFSFSFTLLSTENTAFTKDNICDKIASHYGNNLILATGIIHDNSLNQNFTIDDINVDTEYQNTLKFTALTSGGVSPQNIYSLTMSDVTTSNFVDSVSSNILV